MDIRCWRGLALCVFMLAFARPGLSRDCAASLVADFPLPSLDTTTDLAYLAVVDADTFAQHKTNAIPKRAHLGVLLPIANELLQAANDYTEFSSQRAQQYAHVGFSAAPAELAAYFERLLPQARFDAHDACTGASGFRARVTRADRDFVELMLSWRAPANGHAEATLAKAAVAGGVLLDAAPTRLSRQPQALRLVRNLDVDLRFSAEVDGVAVNVWVPRYITGAALTLNNAATCADSQKLVRALYRQLLEREVKADELRHAAAQLDTKTHNVRQLAERIALGREYQSKFVDPKDRRKALLQLYAHILNREPDRAGLESNLKQFTNADTADMTLSFFRTAEYLNHFGEWTVPGKPPLQRYCPKS